MVILDLMMNLTFQSPNVLWFLILALVPIILHFISIKRYKTFYFSNVGLLKNINQESNSIRKVKDWTLLLIRTLLIVLLVLLFARPEQKQEEGQEGEIALYIDNSLSMSVSNGNVSKLEEVKRQAISLLKSFDFNKKIFLSNSAEIPGKSNYVFRDQAIKRLKELQVTKSRFGLSKSLIDSDFSDVYIFSDLQKGQINLNEIKEDSVTRYHILKSSNLEYCNTFIDTVWIEDSNSEGDKVNSILNYVLSSNCNEPQNISLLQNGQIVSLKQGVKPNEVTSIELSLSADSVYLLSMLVQDSDVEYDNQLDFVLDYRRKKDVLVIGDNPRDKKLESLFTEGSVVFANESDVDFEMIQKSSLIILSMKFVNEGNQSVLNDYVSNGGRLVLYPEKLSDYDNITGLLSQQSLSKEELTNGKVKSFENSSFFKGVFDADNRLSKTSSDHIEKYYINIYKGAEDLAVTEANIPVLQRFLRNQGEIYLFNIQAENLIKTSLFPITLLRVQEAYKSKEIYFRKGSDETIAMLNKPQTISFKKDSSLIKVSNTSLSVNDRRLKTGFLRMERTEKEGEWLALNASKKESLLEFEDVDKDLGPNILVYDDLLSDGNDLKAKSKSYDVYILLIIIFLGVIEMTIFALKK